MKLFRAYKKTRFFLVVNILGLATGLAAAIMLILFVVNEYGYDRHFADADRIVSLNTVLEDANASVHYPIGLRAAYTELPSRVPGIEAAVQIYNMREVEVLRETERTQGVKMFFTDPEFFDVFSMTFVEGSAEQALAAPGSIVITRPRAEAIFGGAAAAMGQSLVIRDVEYTVTAVVEPLPTNTHFTFDALADMESMPQLQNLMGSLEFFTFYLIGAGRSTDDVRAAIEREYNVLLAPFSEYVSGKIYGETERLTDIYLKGKAGATLGKRNTMGFIRVLSALALAILAFAVANFVNLFSAQGETRMREIGVRKTYGAQPADLVRQLFSEVAVLVAVAFAVGMALAVRLTPLFSELIQKEIDVRQFFNPVFLGCVAGLLVVTIVLSASYTSFYLSRQNPLDILGKRLRFSKSRLTTAIVCFQSVVTIVLMSLIIVVNRQSAYLKDIPLGYDPQGVMMVAINSTLTESYDAVRQELLALPIVEAAAGSQHIIGVGGSGQVINLPNSTEKAKSIDEYRINPGLGELMRFELVEGAFFTDDTPGYAIVLNEAAVGMLGLEYPVVDTQVAYSNTTATITGVVRDFVYGDPAGRVQPLALAEPRGMNYFYIRLHEGADRLEAQAAVQAVLREFDPDYLLSPIWSEDIYEGKFADINNMGRIIFVGSLLSIVLAMLGLLAIHLYSAVRRTKEIAIRRINGATRVEIFTLLSRDMLRWILAAGVVAVPVAWWLTTRFYLSTVENHMSLGWAVFVVPIAVQMAAALLVTSGVSIRVSSANPVESLNNN